MCFIKSKESKLLEAKRDIKVYKVGIYADNTSFNPYFYRDFRYSINQTVFEIVDFRNLIERGLHSYIRCKLVPSFFGTTLYSCKDGEWGTYILTLTAYLGEFSIPKGATYCLNSNGEVVSNRLIYTGNYIKIHPDKKYDTRELWKEN